MANTKISQLTATTTPNWWEELVYAYNNANGKMTLDTMKTYAWSGKQDTLVSWTNIKTINGDSILWSWNLVIQWGWWGGTDASYDAIVDASWDGDYTLVSAAIAAWKYNLFVKNWNYTETAWRDPYSNNAWFLRIIWESKEWVQVTIPNTIAAPRRRFIDMNYWWANADFYMENISFNIALLWSNTPVFYSDNGGNVEIRNCSFTYSGSWGTALFNWKAIWDRPHIFNCDLIASDSGWTFISEEDICFYWCSFKTTSGELNFTSSDKCWLYNCNVDASSIDWVTQMHLYNTYFNVTSWTITWELALYHVVDSEVYISNLSTTPSLISIAVASNSVIEIPYELNFWYTYEWDRWTTNCVIKCATLKNPNCMIWCRISASTTFNCGGNNVITWCQFINPMWAMTMQNNNSFVWNYSNQAFTLTISNDNNILIGNNIRSVTITDSWTWNVKANNITA